MVVTRLGPEPQRAHHVRAEELGVVVRAAARDAGESLRAGAGGAGGEVRVSAALHIGRGGGERVDLGLWAKEGGHRAVSHPAGKEAGGGWFHTLRRRMSSWRGSREKNSQLDVTCVWGDKATEIVDSVDDIDRAER